MNYFTILDIFGKKDRKLIYFFFTFTGPELPYKLDDINQAMVTSPDGMGIIIVGGLNTDSGSSEKRILESRFDGSQFLPWKVMDRELDYGRYGHVVLPIPKSITNCNWLPTNLLLTYIMVKFLKAKEIHT